MNQPANVGTMASRYRIKECRESTIQAITRMNLPDNWQNVNTPYKIVRNMLDLIPESDIYVVFFSMEFLEVMIHERNIPNDKIVFVADTEVEQKYASFCEWYNVKSVLYPKQIVTKESIVNVLKDVDMKFKKITVVGNPPYQMQTEAQKNRSSEDAQSKPLYHLFVEAIIDGICPDHFSMIIPSRWMVGGMGLNNHRDRMMNDSRMKKIVHFPGEKQIFDTVSIKGGVNYFLWEKGYSGECEFNGMSRSLNEYDIILQDNSAVSILNKIRSKHSDSWMNSSCYGNKPFGIATNFSDYLPEETNSSITCVSSGRKNNYIDVSEIQDKHDILNMYKVCTSKANGAAQNEDESGKKRVLGDVFIIPKNTACTESYIVVKTFDNECHSNNFITYTKTKFFRFMLGLRVLTQDINKEKFSWVPDMEDYTKEYTDKYLYKKFGLNEEEIAYIESKIKEI